MHRKSIDSYKVKINPDLVNELETRGYVWKTSDGRVMGISRQINRAIDTYLRSV